MKTYEKTIEPLYNLYLDSHPTFSRHAIAQTSLALVIWLNENVLIPS